MRAEGARLARMAGPLVIGQFAVMGMGVTDVIIAGHAGTDDLAAVTIGYYVWDLGMLLVFGILLANSALIGHRFGAVTAMASAASSSNACGCHCRSHCFQALSSGLPFCCCHGSISRRKWRVLRRVISTPPSSRQC